MIQKWRRLHVRSVVILVLVTVTLLRYCIFSGQTVQPQEEQIEQSEASGHVKHVLKSYYSSEDLTVLIADGTSEHRAGLAEGAVSGQPPRSPNEGVYVISGAQDDANTNSIHDYGQYTGIMKSEDDLTGLMVLEKFLPELLKAVIDSQPTVGAINTPEHYNKTNKYPTQKKNKKIQVYEGHLRDNKDSEHVRTKEYLRSYLQLSPEELQSMKDSHKKFLQKMPDKFPEGLGNRFRGRGILYVGGGKYDWLVLLSLKMLRDSGSKLPVEVFIPKGNEFSFDLCNVVYPLLGAKCILMQDYFSSHNYKFKSYQLKSMALLLTSFEEVLFLDSDNLPIKNPDILFFNEPYKSTGMVIWPDFWRRSTSPMYYDLADIQVNETHQVRFSYGDERDHPTPLNTHEDYEWKVSYHDLEGTIPEASSEAGQMLINRRTHARALFLSLYYNFYGPQYYYGLFTQGQAGEGDKETFIAAAHRLGLPYYQVQEYIREFGEFVGDSMLIATMGQYDPILDYLQNESFEKYKDDEWNNDKEGKKYPRHLFKNSELMFLHCNWPKLYPWNIEGQGRRKVLDDNGNPKRLYSDVLSDETGFDAEAKIWSAMHWLLCKYGDLTLKGTDKDPVEWCSKVSAHLEWLQSSRDGRGGGAHTVQT